MRVAWTLLAGLLLLSMQFVYSKILQDNSLKICPPNAGCMVGTLMPGYQGEHFEAFMGIPYAQPPVGELRFSNPKAALRWSGVLNATQPKGDCIQKNYLLPTRPVSGSEDCLYLNVYRPVDRSNKFLPVMVYIHGGGWFSGSANPLIVGPEYFMDTKEVVLVTLAYRLGAFGFLSTGDVNMPGNFGLKDQTLALRWVQRNIASFGGNPRSVTIFGQSAGSISAHLHMLSPESEGLFHRVISMSGTANVPFGILDDPLNQTRYFAELCNISDANVLSPVKLTKALRNIDAESIILAGDGLKYWDVDHMTNFRPVVERDDGADAFLTRHPLDIMRDGRYKAVPWLLSFVPVEGAVRVLGIYSNDKLRSDFNQNFDHLFETLMEFPESFSAAQKKQKTNAILQEYFKGVHEINEDTLQGFLDTITDRGFLNPMYNAISLYLNTSHAQTTPLYVYKFNYYGPPTHTFANLYTGQMSEQNYGVVHCDDLIYTFRSPVLFSDFEKNSTHAEVVAAYVQNFVTFAKDGKPLTTNCACSKRDFRENEFCNYQEFTNAILEGSGCDQEVPDCSPTETYTVSSSHDFNVRRMAMWNDILEATNV